MNSLHRDIISKWLFVLSLSSPLIFLFFSFARAVESKPFACQAVCTSSIEFVNSSINTQSISLYYFVEGTYQAPNSWSATNQLTSACSTRIDTRKKKFANDFSKDKTNALNALFRDSSLESLKNTKLGQTHADSIAKQFLTNFSSQGYNKPVDTNQLTIGQLINSQERAQNAITSTSSVALEISKVQDDKVKLFQIVAATGEVAFNQRTLRARLADANGKNDPLSIENITALALEQGKLESLAALIKNNVVPNLQLVDVESLVQALPYEKQTSINQAGEGAYYKLINSKNENQTNYQKAVYDLVSKLDLAFCQPSNE